MKTKLFFFTSLLLLSIATATAQTKEKGFFVEMNGGYGVWGIERSGFFNGREKWAKGFENQRV